MQRSIYLNGRIEINTFENDERVIKGTKVIAVIKRMQSKDKDQTLKTDIHIKKNIK